MDYGSALLTLKRNTFTKNQLQETQAKTVGQLGQSQVEHGGFCSRRRSFNEQGGAMGCPEPSLNSLLPGTSPCKCQSWQATTSVSMGQSSRLWKGELLNDSISGLLPLGICKVNICSSNFSLSFPAFPFFLFKWKQALTWRKDRPLNIRNSSVLDFH